MKVRWALLARQAAFTLVGLLGAIGIYLGVLQLRGNFHTVVAGELYRSAQPTPQDIEAYAKRYSIRTIINLRGAKPGRGWYDKEVAAAGKLGIRHIDFAMSSSREMKQADAAKLVALLEAAPKPILVHCQAGADRTGLAAALYLANIAKVGEEQAERQISLFFGHVGVPLISRAYAIDRGWEKLEPWLGFFDS